MRDLHLSEEEKAFLAGEAGPAVARAMRILVRMAPLYGASEFLEISRAHIDGIVFEGEAGLEFAEGLARDGGQVRVPTSLNVMSMDRVSWQTLGQDPDFADKARRLGQAYVSMGARPTYTCAPYQTESAPIFGEQLAWSESNAVAYANSVLGARSNRYGDYLDISCALTGRVPAAGFHLAENRAGSSLYRLHEVPGSIQERDDFWPVLGYFLGSRVSHGVPAVDGISVAPTDDQLKSFAAAIATSGAVAMFHLIGITPEAPDIAAAFRERSIPNAQHVTLDELRGVREKLTSARGDSVDVVAFGSPHASLAECRHLSALMDGKRKRTDMQVFVTTSRAVREIADRQGVLAVLEAFGAVVTADTCIAVAPLVKPGARVLMTNSAKYAHYGPGLIGVESVFGSTAACVEAAITGAIPDESGAWT